MALRSLADGSLFAEAIGSSPPRLLALHGWGRRGSDFTASLAGFGALAVDLPGFGATPPPEEPIGARRYAERLVPVLDVFDHPPFLVGHSFGGRVAVCLAAAHPGRVSGLLVTGAPLVRLTPSGRPPFAYRLARVLNRAGIIGDETMESVRRRRGSTDYRAATGVMRDILVTVVNEEYRDELSRLETPLHMVWGSDDTEVPVAVAEEARRIVVSSGGSASLEVVAGAGHLLPVQDPETFRRYLAKRLP